jgi:hypothetical protein
MIKQMSWLDTFLVSLFLVSLLALLLALYSRPGDWSDLYGTVRKWEGFHAQAYRDIGGYSQGYGTAGHPGTTIDRATAEQLMEQELACDCAKIEAINPRTCRKARRRRCPRCFIISVVTSANWISTVCMKQSCAMTLQL